MGVYCVVHFISPLEHHLVVIRSLSLSLLSIYYTRQTSSPLPMTPSMFTGFFYVEKYKRYKKTLSFCYKCSMLRCSSMCWIPRNRFHVAPRGLLLAVTSWSTTSNTSSSAQRGIQIGRVCWCLMCIRVSPFWRLLTHFSVEYCCDP